MTRVGQLLVRADFVTENHLARALGVQHFAGGRIGTLLLERGALHEDDLGRTLAEQHGCEYVPWPTLSNVAPAAIAALPAKFAIRHCAVPYDRGEGFLRIALRDPSDLRILDELFFVTGRKIIAGAAPEVRIFQALEKYYGERRTPRYAILAEKLSRLSSRPTGRAAGPPPPPDFFPDSPSRPASASRSLGGAEGGNAGLPVVKMPDAPLTPWAPIVPAPGTSVAEDEEEVIHWEELSPPSLWIPSPIPAPKPEPVAPPQAPSEKVAPVAAAPIEVPAPVPVAETRVPERLVPPPSPPEAPIEVIAEIAPPAPIPAAKAPRPLPPAPPPVPAVPRTPLPAPAGATRLASEIFDFPEVLAATDRSIAVAETLGALSRRFRRAALFGSKPDRILGLAGAGTAVDSSKLAAIEIPWSEPSVFLNVRLSHAFYLGALPPLPRHRLIAEAMGKWTEECVVQPVWIKDKPVAFLYAEFDPDRGATPMDLAYLRGLAQAAATALAASIRSKRGP
jgi:hypothetical protein